jgi:ABC-type maltose transport system permease subunit
MPRILCSSSILAAISPATDGRSARLCLSHLARFSVFPCFITYDRATCKRLPLGLNALRKSSPPIARNLDLLMAGTRFQVLPSLIFFIVLQRYFIQGIRADWV